MSSDPDLKQFLMRMSPKVAAALDEEAKRLDRSRTWVVQHACELWVRRLQRDRERRELRRQLGV